MGRKTPVHAEIYIKDQQQFEKLVKKFTRKVKKLEKKRLIKRAAEKEKAKHADEYKKR